MEIVVVGGGYAGVMAADRLARKAPGSVRITLVDPNPSFTERIRLHRVAAGLRDSASVPWDEVLHPRVDRLPVLVDRIDVGASRVSLRDGGSLPFDHLVYAVGSGARTTSLLSVTDRESTREAAERVASLEPGSRLHVVGGGLTGVETAAVLAFARPDLEVAIVSPEGIGGAPRQVRAVTRRLDELGVQIVRARVDSDTGVVTVPGVGATSAADATVWTAGFAYPALARDSGLPTTADGRLIVDAGLHVPDVPEIVGAGDAVRVSGAAARHHRASCAAALPMGRHAADAVLARIGGGGGRPLRLRYVLQCLDLADGEGHVQFVTEKDAPRRWDLSGRPGGWVKEGISRSTVAWLRRAART